VVIGEIMIEDLDLKLEDIKELFAKKDEQIERQHAEIQRLREVLKSYQSQWIPCAERLPSEDGFYLVTIHLLSMSNIDFDVTIAKFNSAFEKFSMVSGNNVIAWMPLPKAYQSED
jgi:hypothetical protein